LILEREERTENDGLLWRGTTANYLQPKVSIPPGEEPRRGKCCRVEIVDGGTARFLEWV
jgi:hypothetical protein